MPNAIDADRSTPVATAVSDNAVIDTVVDRRAAVAPEGRPARSWRSAGLPTPQGRTCRAAPPWTPWLVAIGGVCVVLPVVVAALSGNLAIPHNDAWSMSRIAQTFARTGQIRLLNWNDMNLIGLVVMLGPLGSSLVIQQLAVAVLSLLCLVCAYRLLASSLPTRDAILGAALLGLWPGWASLSTSFETDVPTLAATFTALLLGRRALERDSVGWLTAALLVSLWAVSIREQAVVAPIAILTYGWLSRRSRRRLQARELCVAATAVAAILVGFEVWRWQLPFGQNPAVTAGALHFCGQLFAWGARTYFTVAVVLAPAVLLGAGRHQWVRRDVSALGVGVVLVTLAWRCGGLVGRYLAPSGEYLQVLPGTRIVIHRDLWNALLVFGFLSGALLVPLARARWRAVDPLLGLFTMLAYAEIIVIGAAGNGVFDRYLPVLVPGTVAMILPRRRPSKVRLWSRRSRISDARNRLLAATMLRGLAALALALVGVISALLAANGFAFDAARWHTAQRLVKSGVPPTRVAAGMEWTGWHSPHGVIYGHGHGQPGGWQLAFYRVPACVVLSPSPLRPAAAAPENDWTPAGSYAYKTFLIAGHSTLYAYRTRAHGCGA